MNTVPTLAGLRWLAKLDLVREGKEGKGHACGPPAGNSRVKPEGEVARGPPAGNSQGKQVE